MRSAPTLASVLATEFAFTIVLDEDPVVAARENNIADGRVQPHSAVMVNEE